MQEVSQESRGEVKTERMNIALFLELFQESDAPLGQSTLDHDINDALCDRFVQLRAILGAHLLQDGDVEPLSN